MRDSIYRVCHTERKFVIVSQLPRSLFDSGRNVTRVCVHMHAYVRGVPRVCLRMHAWYGLEMVRTYVDVDQRQNMRMRIPSLSLGRKRMV